MESLGRTTVPLLLVVIVLAAVAFLPRRDVGNPVLGLIRVLFPSWRFFDDVQATPSLLVRWSQEGGDLGAWRDLTPQVQRRWPLALLWNPYGNVQLAEHVLLERLMDDVAEWSEDEARDVESLVSYELVLNLVLARLATAGEASGATRFQFKLVDSTPVDGTAGSDLLISAEHVA